MSIEISMPSLLHPSRLNFDEVEATYDEVQSMSFIVITKLRKPKSFEYLSTT